jgi:metal-dependent amidase/aminoacylase/carboxypeptidase family protein
MMSIEVDASALQDLIALRRDIHRWPELAGEERRTAASAAERLHAAGLTVLTDIGGHGVVAVVEGAADGPTVAYRADMDAVSPSGRLPYPRSHSVVDGDFASEVPGVDHLCGHDLHTAIGVGVAQALSRIRDRLPGRVVFYFQPAEETLEGARAMIEAGVLDRFAPQEIYALHCAPLPVGKFGVMPGVGMPGVDQFSINLSGPATAADANRLAASIEALSTVEFPTSFARFHSSFADTFVQGGSPSQFVFTRCGRDATEGPVTVSGLIKAWPDDRYPALRDDLRVLALNAGAQITFLEPSFPAMVCSPRLSEAAAVYLRDAIGPEAVTVQHTSWPFPGEDFALFLQRVPGAMLWLGVANTALGINGSPHTSDFAADEAAIGIGVQAMAGLLSHRLAAAADS